MILKLMSDCDKWSLYQPKQLWLYSFHSQAAILNTVHLSSYKMKGKCNRKKKTRTKKELAEGRIVLALVLELLSWMFIERM